MAFAEDYQTIADQNDQGFIFIDGLELNELALNGPTKTEIERGFTIEEACRILPRLLRRIRYGPGECWEWQGSTDGHGYGQISSHRGHPPYKCHRVSFSLLVGPIPEGFVIRHRCDNPPCINPAHLVPGTQRDNARDASDRGRLNPNSLFNLRPGAPGFRGAGPLSNKELNDGIVE